MKSLSDVHIDFNLHADNFSLRRTEEEKKNLEDRFKKRHSRQLGQCVFVVALSSSEIVYADGFRDTLGYFDEDLKTLERLLNLNHNMDKQDIIDVEDITLNEIIPRYERERWTDIYLKTENTQISRQGELLRNTRKSFLELMDGELFQVNYCDFRKCTKYESRLSFELHMRSLAPSLEDKKRIYQLENEMLLNYLKSTNRIVLKRLDRDILHGFRHFNSNKEVAESLITDISPETVRRRKNKLIERFDRRNLLDLLNHLDEYYYDLRMYQFLVNNNF